MPQGWPANVADAAAALVGTGARAPVALLLVPDGWGRTQTLDAAVALLEARGVSAEVVGGRRAERDTAFGALLPLLGDTAGADAEARRDALDRLTTALGEGGVLIVDDAHWLDDGSMQVLTAMVETAPAAGIGVLVAHRPAARESSDVLDALDAQLARAGAVVRLEPADEQALGERVEKVTGSAADERVAALLVERTGGHARFADRLADAWVTAGSLADGAFVTEPDPTPAALVDAVRVTELSQPARDVLVAIAIGGGDDEIVAHVAGVDRPGVAGIVAELRGAGLLLPGHDEPLPIVADAALAGSDAAMVRDVHRRVAERLRARGAPPTRVAEHIVAAGTRDPEAAEVLAAAGRVVLAEAPAHAAQLFDDAVEAGADPGALAGLRAEACALAGDEERALALAHAETTTPDSAARATVVLGGLLARRGLWSQAERAYRSVHDHPLLPPDAIAALGAVAAVATGRLPDAVPDDGAPANLGADIARLVGRAAIAAGSGDADGARRASAEAAELVAVTGTTAVVLPETPHELGAAVALAVGDVDDAARLAALGRDVAAGGPAAVARHHLVGGFASLRAGHWEQVSAALEQAGRPATTRDAFLTAALQVGMARRVGEVGGLRDAWDALAAPLAAVQSDLFLLLPLAEVVVAAGRLGRREQTRAREDELDTVLDGLGAPGLWTRPLAWARVDAAVAAGDLDGLDRAAAALAATTSAHDRLDQLELAASAWRAVLAGDTETAALLDDGVAALERAGLVWEASRLVGQAAIRAGDPRQTRALLGRARGLKGALPVVDELGGAVGTVLSAREQEVAAGVLDGLTHKEIGALLFISPKTVEHHVARIRQKLGATTRAEMLAGVRATLDPT